MDADTFGERFREVIEEVVHVERTGWAAELVARAQERLKPFVTGPPHVTLVLWIEAANAFTTPGRYIYLSRQLLSRGLSEAGVAFVLAHEIAHHELGHFDAFLRWIGREDGPLSLDSLKVLARYLLESLRFGPEHEVAADRFALDACERAGYGGAGARELFDLLEMIALDFGDVDHVFGHEDEQLESTTLQRIIHVLGQTKLSHPSLHARRQALFGAQRKPMPSSAVPAGFAATGMVFACARCSSRFSEASTCPRCGSSGVADLREPRDRQRFVRIVTRQSMAKQRVPRHLPPAAIGASSLGFFLYLLATGAGAGNAVSGGIIVLLLAGLLWLLVSQFARESFPRDVPRLVLEPVAIAALGSGTEETVRGHVHVRRSVRAPLSGRPCAAWRITGKGPSGLIDDADLGGFDLIRDGRALARVEAPSGFVDLGPMDSPTTRSPDDALAEFLRARGRLPPGATCAVSEAVLLPGDEVEVRGVADLELVSDGLRESHEIHVFRRSPSIRAVAHRM